MSYRFGAVILAAGESRRMGRPKQLLSWGATTVIGAVVGAALDSPVAEIALVLGHAAEQVHEAAAHLLPTAAGSEAPRIRFVLNQQYREGMLASVQAGVEALSPACDGFLLFLGDQPGASPDVAAALAAAYQPGSILIPVHGGRRGHPVLICLRFREELRRLDPAVGLRQLQRLHPEAVREVSVAEPFIHIDLDTPDDYERHRPRR